MTFFLEKLSGFINKTTYTHYIKNRQDSKINLWLNSDEDELDKMGDVTFDFVINGMKKFLDEYYSINKRNINFIKEDKLKKINDDIDSSSSEGTGLSSSDSESESTNPTAESSESTEEEYAEDYPIDEIDKVYDEDNEGAVSLGKYNDLKLEAQFWNQ